MRPALVVPWLLAGVSLVVAVLVLVRNPAQRESLPTSGVSDGEIRTLRLALAGATAESQALRQELDRILSQSRSSDGEADCRFATPRAEPAAEMTEDEAEAERSQALAARYRDAVMRALSGDESAGDEAYTAVLALRRQGPAAFAALRTAYREATDPEARLAMQRMLMAMPGSEIREFVATELGTETDPDVRAALVEKASRLASPETAPLFRDTFLRTLSETDDAARAAAIRGLRWIREDSEVEQAMLAAAADPSDDVRLAAIEALLLRASNRERVRELVAAESSATVRQIGECRLLLTEPRSSP